MGNLQLDANAARVLLAHGAGQLQQRLGQPLFAVRRDQIGDDVLLVGDAHRQVAYKSLRQRVAAQTRKELGTGYLFYLRLFHRHGAFVTCAQPG